MRFYRRFVFFERKLLQFLLNSTKVAGFLAVFERRLITPLQAGLQDFEKINDSHWSTNDPLGSRFVLCLNRRFVFFERKLFQFLLNSTKVAEFLAVFERRLITPLQAGLHDFEKINDSHWSTSDPLGSRFALYLNRRFVFFERKLLQYHVTEI